MTMSFVMNPMDVFAPVEHVRCKEYLYSRVWGNGRHENCDNCLRQSLCFSSPILPWLLISLLSFVAILCNSFFDLNSMDPYSSTVIHSHLNTVQNLLLLMMENNSRILRQLDNVRNKLSACSTTFHEAPKLLDVDASLEDPQESEEFLAPLVIAEPEVDFDLEIGLSRPVDNSKLFPALEIPMGNSLNSNHCSPLVISIGCTETLGTPLDSKYGLEDNPNSYACKVFAEIPDKKIAMEVERPVKNDSINPESHVFDTMFHTVLAVSEYNDLVIFDIPLALPCLFSVCSHAYLIGRAIFDCVSELDHAELILSLHRFPCEYSELYFPFDPGSSFLTTYLGAPQNCVFWDVLGAIFSVCFGPMQQIQVLLFGCIVFFVNLLNNAPSIDEDARLGMAENLRWLLCIFHNEDVYFYVLLLELPTISFLSPKLDKLLIHCRKNALRTLLMVSFSLHSLFPIDSFLTKALVKSHCLYCGIVTATTFQLPLRRIYDSIWFAMAGMKKKVNNASHSWDYTMFRVEQQIWNPHDGIALVFAKLQLIHYILMLRVSAQNILDIHGGLKLDHFPYASDATLYIVTLGGTVLAFFVWDPGFSLKVMNLNGHRETLEARLLLGSTGKFCLCAYSNSITKVWDPGRQGCVTVNILQFVYAFAFACSLSSTHFYSGERYVSSHSTELATREMILPWRTELLVSFIALSAENNGMPGENVDTGAKWLGKASGLQRIRSTDAKKLLVTLGDVLASAMDITIIQQL